MEVEDFDKNIVLNKMFKSNCSSFSLSFYVCINRETIRFLIRKSLHLSTRNRPEPVRNFASVPPTRNAFIEQETFSGRLKLIRRRYVWCLPNSVERSTRLSTNIVDGLQKGGP